MTGTPEQSPAGLRLVAATEEPRHRGLHLAVLCATDAARLGVPADPGAGPLHVRIVNPRTGARGFARLHVSAQAQPSRLAAQGYVLRNAGLTDGQDADVALWDPRTQAAAARSMTLDALDMVLAETDGPALARSARQRLADSGLSVEAGHRFSLPLAGREVTFEVVSAAPADGPVRCTDDTDLTIVDHTVAEPIGSTARPVRETVVLEGIGGLEEPIRRIAELIVWPAEHPELFARLGITTARGIILHGPPGNGKTLLARAVARRLGAHFFAINGPEILSKYYGESEQRLRRVFEDAAREQPSVVFLDELDSIAPSRDSVSGDLEVRLVSQLLTLMDGLTGRGRVVVIAATNRPAAIDPALRRPGRFDHEVEIGPPDRDARHAILEVHTRTIPLAGGVDLPAIADLTVGYVGADLASLCQEAAMAAARRTLAHPAADVAEVEVGPGDFLEGFRHVQPSAFREQRRPVPGPDWDDLVGAHEAKRALTELIDWPMSRRDRLAELGIAYGGGILLTGPPLSGKTTIVTALARRLAAALIYLPSADLISPWAGDTERLIRQAFVKARQSAPSLVFLDDFQQLQVAGADLARRVLAQVDHELTQLSMVSAAFVVVAGRDRAAAADPLFSHVVEMDPPTEADVRAVLGARLGGHLAAEVVLDQIVPRLIGLPVGRVARLCDEALTGALWEDSDKAVVRARHLAVALTRLDGARSTDTEG